MSEFERVRYLRKEMLNLTMEKFGDALGVSKAAISRIESGIVALTDQNRKAICREFNVSESWLRTGEGETFEKNPVAMRSGSTWTGSRALTTPSRLNSPLPWPLWKRKTGR